MTLLVRVNCEFYLSKLLIVFSVPKVQSPWKYHEKPVASKPIDSTTANAQSDTDSPKSPGRLAPLGYQPSPITSAYIPINPSYRRRKALAVSPLSDAAKASLTDISNNHVKSEPFLAHLAPILGDQVEDIFAHVQAIHRAHVAKMKMERKKESCVFPFNELAAVKPELLEQRHASWVEQREQRTSDCQINRQRRYEEFMDHVQAHTTEYRQWMREVAAARAAHQASIQRILTPFFTSVFMQKCLILVQEHRLQEKTSHRLMHFARKWRKYARIQANYASAAFVLRHWLVESVKVKTIARKVFYGLGVFMTKVTLVQTYWRRKVAIRLVNRLRLIKMWDVFELTEPPKPKIIEPEPPKKIDKRMRKKSQKTKSFTEKIEVKTKPYPTLHFPYPKFDESVRMTVIEEVLLEYEQCKREKFRELEEDLFPTLVETLQGIYHDKPRSYVRKIAFQHLLLGSVFTWLKGIPDLVDEATINNYSSLCVSSTDMLCVFHRANKIINHAAYINVEEAANPIFFSTRTI
ncbi:hypothetical protein THRCLA_22437 [Thraustotheca clavata]|uniref:Uncharacterized protein n=1 Tax=Thraustotheca clavata TaxID=74557 RepID=A0A1V9Z161_9STRA|nr:hypothetical protein THRCLA_22437 [Thraustotheca clavata]